MKLSLYHATKERILSKNSTKAATWKLASGPFVFAKNQAQLLLQNGIFEANY